MKVFISHASADAPLARRLADSLRAAGWDAWDSTRVGPGADWNEENRRALREAGAMVVLLTRDSVRSSSVSNDLSYALGHVHFKGRVIPVLAARPHEMAETRAQVPWVLNRFQSVQLTDREHPEEAFRSVAQILRRAA